MRRKINGSDYSGYILPAGLLIGGYLVAKNFGLFGSQSNNANNNQVTTTTTDGINTAIQQNAGGTQTLSDAVLAGMADSIFSLYGTDDPSDIRRIVIQCNTTLDALKLAKAFGTKEVAIDGFSTCAFFGFNCQSVNLAAYLRLVLPSTEINVINNYFSATGINFSV
jgi:hypothetical protein